MIQPPAQTLTRRFPGNRSVTEPATRACTVSLIIPTRNEELSLPVLVETLADVLDDSYEVILVDDSDDQTVNLALRLAAEYRLNLSVIHREIDQRQGGLSTAVLAGVDAAYGDYVCIMDANLQHPPQLIDVMLKAARRSESDIVIASRYVEGGSDAGLSSRARRMISSITKRLVKTVFKDRLSAVTDPLSGFFLARRTLLDETALRPIGFKILLDILVRSNWKVVTEVPLRFERRAAGDSNATLKQGLDFLSHVAQLRWETQTGQIKVRHGASARAETQVTQA